VGARVERSAIREVKQDSLGWALLGILPAGRRCKIEPPQPGIQDGAVDLAHLSLRYRPVTLNQAQGG